MLFSRLWLCCLALGLFSACASFSADGGFDSVRASAKKHLDKEVVWVKSDSQRDTVARRVDDLLSKKPLGLDDAVQIALLNSRGLQAAFAQLQISEADFVQAGRLSNPHFSMMRAKHDGDYKIEQALTWNIFSLFTLPQARAAEKRLFEQTQREVSMSVVRLASDTRKAYYSAVAAQEALSYAQQIQQAADAGAELAQRMKKAGNFNTLEQAQEEGFQAEARLGLIRAQQEKASTREALSRFMGLPDKQAAAYTLPPRLPDLPTKPQELPLIERQALEDRLDVQAARARTEALAKNLGLTKTTRFINVLELGPARVLEGAKDSPYKKGYEISFELPLFDWGGAKVAKAEGQYMQALHQAAQTVSGAQSEVRQAYHHYRANYDIACHWRDVILPLNKRISAENQLRYNGMFISVFDLLASARNQIGSVKEYMHALRDFWLAQADLEMALIGSPTS